MPEGPEVRRYADELANVLVGKKITEISARTKNAKAWLATHAGELTGQKVISVTAHGKNIIGTTDGGYYFYSHQMMWGRWHIMTPTEASVADRRERARIAIKNKVAVLMSAPIFEVGSGDPYKQIKYLKNLGPNILSYNGSVFDEKEFLKRLNAAAKLDRTIGAALLDQSILAGIGNYLRAEIMFVGRIDPWTKLIDLSKKDKKLLCKIIPEMAERAYARHGVTVTEELQARMKKDSALVYVPGREYGTHHYVFRRTNLPCLVCNEPVKQLRQALPNQVDDDEVIVAPDADEADQADEKSRIVYFCANCQNVDTVKVASEQPKSNSKRK